MTIHKAQGLTLETVVLDIGKSEVGSGASYVGFSRVRNLSDLALSHLFSRERINNIQNSIKMQDGVAFMMKRDLI